MPRLVLGLYLIGCISGWHESDLDQSQSQSNFYRFRYRMKMIFTNFKLEQNTLTILVPKVKEGYSLIGYKSHRICLPKEISPDKSTDISFRLSQGKLKPVKSLCFFFEKILPLTFRLFLQYLLKLLNDYVDSEIKTWSKNVCQKFIVGCFSVIFRNLHLQLRRFNDSKSNKLS